MVRPPAEHRFLGLDRRTFAPALAVIAVALLWAVVMPLINRSVAYDDPVEPGDVIQLAPGITFTPAEGWNVESGLRVGDETRSGQQGEAAHLSYQGVSFTVTPGPFSGEPEELLAQLDKVFSATATKEAFTVGTDHEAVTTDHGEQGVVASYSGASKSGVIAAFVIGGTGLSITAFGPESSMREALDDIADMIASVRGEAEGGDEG